MRSIFWEHRALYDKNYQVARIRNYEWSSALQSKKTLAKQTCQQTQHNKRNKQKQNFLQYTNSKKEPKFDLTLSFHLVHFPNDSPWEIEKLKINKYLSSWIISPDQNGI